MTTLFEDMPTTVLDEKDFPALIIESTRVHVEVHSDGRVFVNRGTVELAPRACLSAASTRDGLMPPRPAVPGRYRGAIRDTTPSQPVAKARTRSALFASLVRFASDARAHDPRSHDHDADTAPVEAGPTVLDFPSRYARNTRRSSKAAPSTPGTPGIGEHIADNTVYAGISPSTGQPMYTTAEDSCLCESWVEAMNYAANVTMHGHEDWRAPTKAELHQLFTHRAAIGNFNNMGHITHGRYWSSSREDMTCAWVQPLLDGSSVRVMALRCVRG